MVNVYLKSFLTWASILLKIFLFKALNAFLLCGSELFR